MRKCYSLGCFNPALPSRPWCVLHSPPKGIRDYHSRWYPRLHDVWYVGIELECHFSTPIAKRAGPHLGMATYDGSLGADGMEFKLCRRARDIVPEAVRLAKRIAAYGGSVDRRCGFHVHLDCRDVRRDDVQALFAWFRATEEIWLACIPPRRRRSDYVQRLGEDICGHYQWANWTSYQTVEIRLHPGTLNPYKIAAWLRLLIHLWLKMYLRELDDGWRLSRVQAMEAALAQWPPSLPLPSSYERLVHSEAWKMFWYVLFDAPPLAVEYLQTRLSHGGILSERRAS